MTRVSKAQRRAHPKLDRLREVAILANAWESDLRWLETVADEVEVVPGQVIVAAGELLRAVVVPADPDGPARWDDPFRSTSVGYIVGASAVASRRQQRATVTAAARLRLWLIPVAQFELLRERFPAVELAMIDEARRLMG